MMKDFTKAIKPTGAAFTKKKIIVAMLSKFAD